MKYLLIPLLTILTINACCQQYLQDSKQITISTDKKYLQHNNNRISPRYDSITTGNNYFFAHTKNHIAIYTKDSAKLVAKNTRAIQLIPGTYDGYQLLVGNKIYWLNKKQTLLNANPNDFSWIILCGTVPNFYCHLKNETTSSYLKIEAAYGTEKYPELSDSIDFTAVAYNSSFRFLNNDFNYHYDANRIPENGLDAYTLFEKEKGKKTNIIKLIKDHDSIKKITLVQNIDKVFFNDGPFIHPFIFEQNHLLGYYPCNHKAIYQFINPMDYNFARFELPNGKKGWLEINGKEYYDQ